MDPPSRRRAPKPPDSVRLDATAWVDCALGVLANRGIEGVRVEVLAKLLGVTKGSFYWHFADRPTLLKSMLQEWRRRATLGVIERYESTQEDAPRRLARLLRLQFDTKNAQIGAEIELSVRLWGRHDTDAARVLREIDDLRLRYIGTLLQASGIAAEATQARAVIIYCYMRVSRALLHPNRDREMLQLCQSMLSCM